MKSWMYIVCCFILVRDGFAHELSNDADLYITDIYEKYGYPTETYEVPTEDGYLLTLFRIPHGRLNESTAETNRTPVLLFHGLLGSAENFMYIGPNKSLSYLLADRGYDVWLGNARGNMHSRKHKTLNPDTNKTFWYFSWHEIGVYDLPATIDFVLNKTGHSSLHYIGHSQGCTSFFVMASERPEYNQKIKLMVALAPAVFMQYMKNDFFRAISKHYIFLEQLATSLNIMEFIPFLRNGDLRTAGRSLCGGDTLLKIICINLIRAFTGPESKQLDKSIIPFVLSTVPAGAATRQPLHYAQSITSGSFRQYDYGPKKNLKKYKSKLPPKYYLKNVTAPVALFYGDNDELAATQDVIRLSKLLPNLVEIYRVPYDNFTHMDFVWATDSIDLCYNEVMKLLHKFDKRKY